MHVDLNRVRDRVAAMPAGTEFITTDNGVIVERRPDGWFAVSHRMRPYPFPNFNVADNFVAEPECDDEVAAHNADFLNTGWEI